MPSAKRRSTFIGERFGRLTVVSHAPPKSDGRKRFLCRCDCGREVIVSGSQLGHRTKSCGCLFKEVQLATVTKHGQRYSSVYETWCGIKQRCYNPKKHNYERYGGRGIKLCQEWHDFQTFFDYVSKLPNFGAPGYSLDRIDFNGNYEPGNVRWATMKEQANNKRNNHYIELNGERHSIAEWAEITGLNYGTLKSRIKRGKTPAEALKPLRKG